MLFRFACVEQYPPKYTVSHSEKLKIQLLLTWLEFAFIRFASVQLLKSYISQHLHTINEGVVIKVEISTIINSSLSHG